MPVRCRSLYVKPASDPAIAANAARQLPAPRVNLAFCEALSSVRPASGTRLRPGEPRSHRARSAPVAVRAGAADQS